MGAKAEALYLASLLREWRQAPFFERREDWERWVNDFGCRVDKALRSVDRHWCPKCGGCRVSLACCYTTCECD